MAVTNSTFDAKLPRPEYLPTEAAYRSSYDYTHQYEPDKCDQLMKTRANQKLTGMLDMFGSKEAMTADKHIWGEEGVRHAFYSGVSIDVTEDDDEAELDFSSSISGDNNYIAYGEHDVIAVYSPTDDVMLQGIVKEDSISDTAHTLTLIVKNATNWNDIVADRTNISTFKVGSNYGKGEVAASRSVTRTVDLFSMKPAIAKANYEMNNTDLTNAVWLEPEPGVAYWWLGDIEETEKRFRDDIEKQCTLEATTTNTALGNTASNSYGNGSTGLFPTIESRGGNYEGYPVTLDDFDDFLSYYNSVDAEAYNIAMLNQEFDLAIDDMIMKLGGQVDNSSSEVFGRYFGDFENGKKYFDFAFKGFNRGSYGFAKQGWRLLRSHQVFGNTVFASSDEKVNALFLPSGEGKVSDDADGNNKKNVPYLTMMYKANPYYSREFEVEWRGTKGTQSIAADKTTVDFRTERGLRVVAAEKFVLAKGQNS